MEALLVIVVVLIVAGLITVGRSIRVVQQYGQGIVFRFGRVLPAPHGGVGADQGGRIDDAPSPLPAR